MVRMQPFTFLDMAVRTGRPFILQATLPHQRQQFGLALAPCSSIRSSWNSTGDLCPCVSIFAKAAPPPIRRGFKVVSPLISKTRQCRGAAGIRLHRHARRSHFGGLTALCKKRTNPS